MLMHEKPCVIPILSDVNKCLFSFFSFFFFFVFFFFFFFCFFFFLFCFVLFLQKMSPGSSFKLKENLNIMSCLTVCKIYENSNFKCSLFIFRKPLLCACPKVGSAPVLLDRFIKNA